MMDKRLDEQEIRIESLETYMENFNVWADRLLSILERAITLMPDVLREQFFAETEELKITRPRRSKKFE